MSYLHTLAIVLALAASMLGALHALLTKRDPRSAFAWIAICLMWPVVGVIIYLTFGKNRIQTRAKQLHGEIALDHHAGVLDQDDSIIAAMGIPHHYLGQTRLAQSASMRPLTQGNQVELLVNGESAYPAMLLAIRNARHCVYLGSYIFDGVKIGAQFVEALAEAVTRGVEVRVLVDGVGRLYSWPRVTRALAKAHVPYSVYLPPGLLPPKFTINLRNHRKILVVDSEIAFTGGMNIRQHHLVDDGPKRNRTDDIHFRIRGPVVAQLQDVFITDWRFSNEMPIAPCESTGEAFDDACCRVITDGPNQDLEKLTHILMGALSVARESVCIMTPYFLPSRDLQVALQMAAFRGVQVKVVMPKRNNMPFVKWAGYHIMDEMLAAGVQFYQYSGNFLHSKLFIVDDYYSVIGSSNLDQRSLRLNFEVAVEAYSETLGADLREYFDQGLAQSVEITEQTLASRPAFRRFVDALFWLMSPYL